MNKKTTTIFLSSAIIAASLWLNERTKSAPVVNSFDKSVSDPRSIRLKSDLAAARSQTAASIKERDELIVALEKAKKKPESADVLVSSLEGKTESPLNELDKSMKENSRQYFKSQNIRLFKKLALSPEETEKFTDLMVQENSISNEAFMMQQEGCYSIDIEEGHGERLLGIKEQIKTLIGTRYSIFQDYKEKQIGYIIVSNFEASLAKKSMSELPDDKADELVTIVSDIFNALATVGLNEIKSMSQEDLKSSEVANKAIREKIIESSGLTDDQKEILKEQLEIFNFL